MTRLVDDDLGHAMPLVRPLDAGATTKIVDTNGDVVDIAAETRVWSIACDGGNGRYRIGNATLTGGQANHFIFDGERLT